MSDYAELCSTHICGDCYRCNLNLVAEAASKYCIDLAAALEAVDRMKDAVCTRDATIASLRAELADARALIFRLTAVTRFTCEAACDGCGRCDCSRGDAQRFLVAHPVLGAKGTP